MLHFLFRARATLLFLAALAVFGCQISAAQIPQPPSIVGSKPLYGLSGATGWLNSRPLTARELKGKVVLIDFWTYSCINCLRSMPYIEAWAQKYKSSGLVVIGVETPEFHFEQELPNVRKAIQKYGITFPVALDSNYSIWNAFHNEFWPADYFIAIRGKVRYEHFGEGDYAESERWIQNLLKERDAHSMLGGLVHVHGQGAEEAADASQMESPETYIGYERTAHFASQGGIHEDAAHLYTLPTRVELNQWGLGGKWIDHKHVAVLKSPNGEITFHFHARDLHLVLGPARDGQPIRFRVTIDGHAPGEDHGVDADAQGYGVVRQYRLYQLVRQRDGVKDQIFTIQFLDPGVQAYSFTFG